MQDTIVKPSRKRNPGVWRTRKDAIREAIRRCEADPARTFNRRGTWYVIGKGRQWSIVSTPPANAGFWGPITLDTVEKYRHWYL